MMDMIRVCAAAPRVIPGDPAANAEEICRVLSETEEAAVLVFPELALSGATCGDLFGQSALIRRTEEALETVRQATRGRKGLVAVGAPLRLFQKLYDTAVLLQNGRVLGIVPKTVGVSAPFSASAEEGVCTVLREEVPFGKRLIFDCENVRVGAVLGEELGAPTGEAASLCLRGAEVLVHLAAFPERAEREEFFMLRARSAEASAVCVSASAGAGESSTDFVFGGHTAIAVNGRLLCADPVGNGIAAADVDPEPIRSDRRADPAFVPLADGRTVCGSAVAESDGSKAMISRRPFLPQGREEEYAARVFALQTAGLRRRLSVTGGKTVVGVSGGLDSTLALLVCAEAAEDRRDVCGVTMPCFGTTDRTYRNAVSLMHALGITVREIPIRDAVRQHFADIGHDEAKRDVTYENAQARERTQVLMDVANELGAIVVGTGDLSELALGWCTYSGDQMSMYGVNAGVMKTLLRDVIGSVIAQNRFPDANAILRDILDTPISPELLPPDEGGAIAQKTEDLVGPYELHDFFLFYLLRYGFSPAKIAAYAVRAFDGQYGRDEIVKWLKNFYRRFFTQQFKRSCMPDGVGIGALSLSPREGFRMPSDASFAAWRKELDEL